MEQIKLNIEEKQWYVKLLGAGFSSTDACLWARVKVYTEQKKIKCNTLEEFVNLCEDSGCFTDSEIYNIKYGIIKSTLKTTLTDIRVYLENIFK